MEKDLYFVAVKIFLEDKEGNLLILKDKFGDWDIPGGRLRGNDFETAFIEIIERKIKEELGDKVRYNIQEPIVFMRHERNEVLSGGKREKRRIFAIGYGAEYLDGDIVLGKSHEKYEWVKIDNFVPENYFKGGWLKGVKEYLQNKRV
jgi:hypothetical protein